MASKTSHHALDFPAGSPLHLGDKVGGGDQGFVVEGYIGGGGFAHIYRVHDMNRRTTAAMKVLKPALRSDGSEETGLTEARQRFDREMLLLGQMSSNVFTPNLIRRGEWVSLRTQQHLDYFVMDCVEGLTLSAAIKRAKRGQHIVQGYHFEEGKMVPLDCMNFLKMVMQCLRQVHTLEESLRGEQAEFTGYVHRDLKTVNIMLPDVFQGYQGQVMVLDFGIAGVHVEGCQSQETDHNLTMQNSATFTPKYAAPEQVIPGQGYGPYTDIYAMGVIAYELLTGQYPYTHVDPRELMIEIVRPDRQLELPDEPRLRGIAPIINRMLRKEVAERPQTAQEVYQMLEQVRLPQLTPPPSLAPVRSFKTQDLSFEAERSALRDRLGATLPPSPHFFDLEGDQVTQVLDKKKSGADPDTERLPVQTYEGDPVEEEDDTQPDEDRSVDESEDIPSLVGDVPLESVPSREQTPEAPVPSYPAVTAREEASPSVKRDSSRRAMILIALLLLVIVALVGGLVWQIQGTEEPKSMDPSNKAIVVAKSEELDAPEEPVDVRPSFDAASLAVAQGYEKAKVRAEQETRVAKDDVSPRGRPQQSPEKAVASTTRHTKPKEQETSMRTSPVRPGKAGQKAKSSTKEEKKVEPSNEPEIDFNAWGVR